MCKVFGFVHKFSSHAHPLFLESYTLTRKTDNWLFPDSDPVGLEECTLEKTPASQSGPVLSRRADTITLDTGWLRGTEHTWSDQSETCSHTIS